MFHNSKSSADVLSMNINYRRSGGGWRGEAAMSSFWIRKRDKNWKSFLIKKWRSFVSLELRFFFFKKKGVSSCLIKSALQWKGEEFSKPKCLSLSYLHKHERLLDPDFLVIIKETKCIIMSCTGTVVMPPCWTVAGSFRKEGKSESSYW